MCEDTSTSTGGESDPRPASAATHPTEDSGLAESGRADSGQADDIDRDPSNGNDESANGLPLTSDAPSVDIHFEEPWDPAALEWDDDLADVFGGASETSLDSADDPLGQDTDSTPYAHSEAANSLLAELRLYARRRFQRRDDRDDSAHTSHSGARSAVQLPRQFGRSVLMSGVRGAGKTATVYWVIRELQAELNRREQPVRLLPVLLSASTFLEVGLSGEQTDSLHSRQSNAPDEPDPDDDAETPAPTQPSEPRHRFLETLCCALHRTVTHEFLRSIRTRIDNRIARESSQRTATGRTSGPPTWRHRAQVETVAQLEQEIEEFVHPSRLREYWTRLDLLRPPSGGSALFDPLSRAATHLLPDQGIQEVSLLTTLNRLYLRVTGDYRKNASAAVHGTGKRDFAQSILDADKWRPILAGLFGGVVTGAGAAAATGLDTVTVVTAVGGTIIASLLSTLFPSVRSQQDLTSTTQFDRDYSLRTLHLEIPRIIDGMFQVGLCPIFIIDELDKVPGLHSQMAGVLQYLKHFFRSDGFFVFLTHREFYDDLVRREQADPVSVTTTWFTDRLFIEFTPWDIRRFFRRRVRPDITGVERQPDRDAVTQFLVAWEYVLLFRSGGTMAELWRQYTRIPFVAGAINVSQRVPDVYLVECLFEVALELELERLLTLGMIGRSPGSIQQMRYFLRIPARRWKAGADSLSGIDDEIDRTGAELLDSVPAEPNASDQQAASSELSGLEDRLPGFSRTMISGSIREVCATLETPGLLAERIKSSVHQERFHNWLLRDAQHLLPILEFKRRGQRWTIHYEPNGIHRTAPTADAARQRLDESLARIDQVRDILREHWQSDLPGNRSPGLDWLNLSGLISSDHDWNRIEQSMVRMERADSSPAELQRAVDEIVAFADELNASLPCVTTGLLLARVLRELTSADSRQVFDAIRIWATEGLGRSLTAARKLDNLTEILSHLPVKYLPQSRVANESIDVSISQMARDDWSGAIERLSECLADISSGDPADRVPQSRLRVRARLAAWNHLAASLINDTADAFVDTSQWKRPEGRSAMLLSALFGEFPGVLLRADLDKVKIREWSQLFLAAIDASVNDPQDMVPDSGCAPWSASVALRALGYRGPILLDILRAFETDSDSLRTWHQQWDDDWIGVASEYDVDISPSPFERLTEAWTAESSMVTRFFETRMADVSDADTGDTRQQKIEVRHPAVPETDPNTGRFLLDVLIPESDASELAGLVPARSTPAESHPCLSLTLDEIQRLQPGTGDTAQRLANAGFWKLRSMFVEALDPEARESDLGIGSLLQNTLILGVSSDTRAVQSQPHTVEFSESVAEMMNQRDALLLHDGGA